MQTVIINEQSVVECFNVLSDPKPDPNLQKQADNYLIQCEQSCSQFISTLLIIFENQQNPLIKLQALICFSNVVKRNYLNKRGKDSTLPNFEKLKASIKQKLISYLVNAPVMYRKTLLDIIVFIAHIDYPHIFDQLTNYMEHMLSDVQDLDFLKQNLRALSEIYKRKQKRSISLSNKHFQSSSLKILIKLYAISQNLFTNIQTLDQKQFSLLRSTIKVELLILATAPNEIIDNQQLLKVIQSLYDKLQKLLLMIVSQQNKGEKIDSSVIEKEHLLKSLIQYFGLLQYKHPYSLVLCFSRYLQALIHVINQNQQFNNQQVVKYSVIALTKVLKTFIYYSSDEQFNASTHSKSRHVNFLAFRNKIHSQFKEVINEKSIQELLSKVISEVLSLKDYDSFDAGIGVEDQEGKMDQKEASIQRLSLSLIEVIINRFPQYSYNLITALVSSCISSEFANVDKNLKVNIMNVCSILPSALKGNNSSLLLTFPIQSLISFAFNSSDLADKFALLSCKWIHKFSPEQTSQIVNALLAFIDANSNNVGILIECCLAIKTIILNKSQELDLSSAVQKIIPIAIKLFSNTESVQILWPMITLISKLISSVECNIQTLQNALACNSLINLLQTNEELIIEALCEMFRNILCTLPRDQPQPVTYDLVLSFLSNQLVKTHLAGYQQVLRLWYLTLRQYNRVQNKDNQLKTLFQRYYKLSLQSTFHQKLLYILQEYVLLDLIENNLSVFTSILNQFYEHGGQEMVEDDTYKLKIAAVSVHITFITKFGIENSHNNELVLHYVDDLVVTTSNPANSKLADTFKTSLLTVINRYIILFKQQFFAFLSGANKYSINEFLRAWFTAMQSLTSKAACKINAIALLYMLEDLQPELLKNRFQFIMKKVIPQTIQSLSSIPFQAKVGVSPTYRMSQNILSQRKQSIRREGVFQEINLKQLFVTIMKNLIGKNVIDQQSVEGLLGEDKVLLESFYKLVS